MKKNNRTIKVKTRILFAFMSVILLFGLCISLFGLVVIKENIIDKAQETVSNDLKTARTLYDSQLEKMRVAFDFAGKTSDIKILKETLQLDYAYAVKKEDFSGLKSDIACAAINSKAGRVSTRIMTPEELKVVSPKLFENMQMNIIATKQARNTDKKTLSSVMSIEFAKPVVQTSGEVSAVICGGKIINKNFGLVDMIHDAVFENRMYNNKPIGTVTIFQDDVRVATNVLDGTGRRAVGTRMSEIVYQRVVEQDKKWIDRAFVVTDWYLTGYEPIKDIYGNIIGVLYVGILEKPFIDMRNNIMLVFFAIIAGVSVIGIMWAFLIADSISRPLVNIFNGTKEISRGDLSTRIDIESSIKEIDGLAQSFNDMTAKLAERESRLAASNFKLSELNKSYLDLIGFVSHELKGILASTILNAYAVRDGFLGMINFKQRKALDSITRNLDYLSSTVINFLNLSRIEKGEIEMHIVETNLAHDIVQDAIDAFFKQASEKYMEIINEVDDKVFVEADPDMLKIVMNNLVGNALKYGVKTGRIIIRTIDEGGPNIKVEVYNDGTPLTVEEIDKLFKKFSRIKKKEFRTIKGTGLGLFITREIVQRHNGAIWVQAGEDGNSFIMEIPKVKKRQSI